MFQEVLADLKSHISETNRQKMNFSGMAEVMEAVMGAAMEEVMGMGAIAKAQALELPVLSRYCCAASLIGIRDRMIQQLKRLKSINQQYISEASIKNLFIDVSQLLCRAPTATATTANVRRVTSRVEDMAMGEAMVRLITFGQEILYAFSKSVWAYNTLALIREEILLWWNGRRVLPLRLLQSIPNLCRYLLIHSLINDH